MSREFIHQSQPGRVVFGAGRRAGLREEAVRLNLRRLLVLATPGGAETAAEVVAPLGDLIAELYPHAVMHVPAGVAAKAVQRARDLAVDGCVAVGGGSAIGLGKAVAKETGLPLLAVPTTYAGSEMTSIWGITDGGRKRTGRDPRVQPVTVIYDPELTLTLPAAVSAASGVNALAHSAEALYAPDASPIVSLMAGESARALAAALPRVIADPADVGARAEALYGAWLAGVCLGSTTMSLHHKLCHILGGTFDLPHALTHANVLSHVLAYNLPAAPEAAAALRTALGTDDPAAGVYRLVTDLGVAKPLHELGLPADGIETVVELAVAEPYANPRPVTADAVRTIIYEAYHGTPPSMR
jgi:maleylacetate reductase